MSTSNDNTWRERTAALMVRVADRTTADDYATVVRQREVHRPVAPDFDVPAWRSEMRKLARAEKVSLRTTVQPGWVHAYQARELTPEETTKALDHMRDVIAWDKPNPFSRARDRGHAPSLTFQDPDGAERVIGCDTCGRFGFAAPDLEAGDIFEHECDA